MPIYFRSTPVSAPYMFDSIGNHWLEEATCRPEGYPHYHYLQTESGCGEIEIQGKIYELQENEGFLIAPSIPHSYKRKSDTWFTLFATFTGTLEASIPSLLQNRSVIWTDSSQSLVIADQIASCVDMISAHGQQDTRYLSTSCYSLLRKRSVPHAGSSLSTLYRSRCAGNRNKFFFRSHSTGTE